MPGISQQPEDRPQIAGAICAPPTHNSEEQVNGNMNSNQVGQLRQPSSLQGLLRFAMDATRAEDAPGDAMFGPMDEERRKFLEDALKAMTIDVVEVLQEQIGKLQDVASVKAADDVAKYTDALETILEYVDQIDIANDFHKIGGFVILEPCLKCDHPKVRASGCELLAELCQNNLYCQRVVLDNEFMPLLLRILERENEDQVIVKGLYALSGIVRDNVEGFNQLIHYKGLETLKKILQRKEEKCITKITFLLASLCRTQPDIKSRLIFLDYLPLLISLLSDERKPSQEHVLSFFMSLVEENSTAIMECRNPAYNLKDVLQNYLASIRNKEECLEEEQYCKRLLQVVFNIN